MDTRQLRRPARFVSSTAIAALLLIFVIGGMVLAQESTTATTTAPMPAVPAEPVVTQSTIPTQNLLSVLRDGGPLMIAIGGCSCSGLMFRESYNWDEPVGNYIPVNAFVPGCPPKPEAIIAAVVKLIEKLKRQSKS